MKRRSRNKYGECWGADNPSLLWLSFVVVFLLPWLQRVGAWLPSLAMAVAVLWLLLFVRGTKRHRHSWRISLFLPVLLLLLLNLLTLYLAPQCLVTGGLLSVALSAGWLWRIEDLLSKECPFSVEEWLFSARLFGLGSLVYLLLRQLWLWRYPWADDLLPILLILAGVVLHQERAVKSARCVAQSFSCPIGTPLVRMAIVRGNQLWLTKYPYTGCYMEDDLNNPCHSAIFRDHPLTSCVNAGETPEEALHRAYLSTGLRLKEEPRFMLKYSYSSAEENSRIVYLYVLNLRTLRPHEHSHREQRLHLRGQFFSPEKIEKLIQQGFFKPLFIEEYTYLKNTLLRANQLVK